MAKPKKVKFKDGTIGLFDAANKPARTFVQCDRACGRKLMDFEALQGNTCTRCRRIELFQKEAALDPGVMELERAIYEDKSLFELDGKVLRYEYIVYQHVKEHGRRVEVIELTGNTTIYRSKDIWTPTGLAILNILKSTGVLIGTIL